MEVVWLLGLLLVAHFLGDFTHLATDRMQEAKLAGRPLAWILAHAAVHGVLVLLVVWAVTGASSSLILVAAGIELGTHFVIDAARASIGVRIPVLQDSFHRAHWYALGFDQLAHGLVLVWIAALVTG